MPILLIVLGAIAAASTGVRRADAWMTAAAGDIAAAGLPMTTTQSPSGPASAVAPPVMSNAPSSDLTVDMPNLVMATDAFRLNLAVMARAQDTYESIIDMARHI